MAETTTPNYHWIKPDIGGDNSTWGNVLNTTFDAIDAVAYSHQVNYLPLTGGTVTGAIVVNGLTNYNGWTVSQALGAGDAWFVLADNTAATKGYLTWNHTNNIVSLINQTGNGTLSINTDGSISTNGVFHAGNSTFTGVTVNGNEIVSGTLAAGNSVFTGVTVNGNEQVNGSLAVTGGINSGAACGFRDRVYIQQITGVYGVQLNNVAGAFAGSFACRGDTDSAIGIFTNYGGGSIYIDSGGNFFYSGGVDRAWKTTAGSWLGYSDARIKNVQGEYTAGLDAILQLRPITYTLKGNVQSHLEEPSMHAQAAEERREYVGLVAQEAEIAMPDIISRGPGYIDGKAVNDLRALDPSNLVYALINAVKELKAEIEELKAAR